MQEFELDLTGNAQGLVTAPCKPDNEIFEFHKRPGNLPNRCAVIDFSVRFCFMMLRNYGGWNLEKINQIFISLIYFVQPSYRFTCLMGLFQSRYGASGCKWTATAQDKNGRSKYVQYAETDSQQRVVLQIGDCARDYHPPQKKRLAPYKTPHPPHTYN